MSTNSPRGTIFDRSRVERSGNSAAPSRSRWCFCAHLWGATGPVFGWSDTWQLVINTGTTIVTFLMVFLIQNAQNRDTQALIRVNTEARNSLMGLEEKSESEVQDNKSALVDFASSTDTAITQRASP
jgi:low affinity Fe/Cu permease